MKLSFYLDQVFQDGTTPAQAVEIKRMMREGRSIKQFLNDKETSMYAGIVLKDAFIKVRIHEKILPIHWDQKLQKVKSTHPTAPEFNSDLLALKADIDRRYRNLLNTTPRVTTIMIKKIMLEAVNRIQPVINSKTFFEALEEFLKVKAPFFKKNNVRKYRTLINFLKMYEKESSVIEFESIDEKFFEQMQVYLIKNGKLNNTIAKYLSNLKAFLRWAIDQDYYHTPKVLNYKIKYDETDLLHLTSEELGQVENVDLSHSPHLDRARAIFCFMCYCGQRYSDIKRMRYSDVVKSGENYTWILKQEKGNKSKAVHVFLIPKAISILKKYPNRFEEHNETAEPQDIINDLILPAFSDQVMNRHLKKIGALAGLNDITTQVKYSGKERKDFVKKKSKFLTTHVARRTFVTQSLEKKIRPEIIQAITGHEDYRVMKKYIKLTDQVKRNEFLKGWEKSSEN
jgi:integrase